MDRRNEELKADQAYVIRYATNDVEIPSKYYRCFGRTSLESAIKFHESRNDDFTVQIAVSESPY